MQTRFFLPGCVLFWLVHGRQHGSTQDRPNSCQQCLAIKWFWQKRQVDVLASDLTHIRPRHHNHLDSRSFFEQMSTQIQTVEPWHFHISDYQIYCAGYLRESCSPSCPSEAKRTIYPAACNRSVTILRISTSSSATRMTGCCTPKERGSGRLISGPSVILVYVRLQFLAVNVFATNVAVMSDCLCTAEHIVTSLYGS